MLTALLCNAVFFPITLQAPLMNSSKFGCPHVNNCE